MRFLQNLAWRSARGRNKGHYGLNPLQTTMSRFGSDLDKIDSHDGPASAALDHQAFQPLLPRKVCVYLRVASISLSQRTVLSEHLASVNAVPVVVTAPFRRDSDKKAIHSLFILSYTSSARPFHPHEAIHSSGALYSTHCLPPIIHLRLTGFAC